MVLILLLISSTGPLGNDVSKLFLILIKVRLVCLTGSSISVANRVSYSNGFEFA
ncbi:hypothetical protein [Ligilactobacillus acidipiscis]|uniref:hypothetical protein n=1 Tax=Ligilactobacillus acidipiscis TaxID=89059 RepID=UPI0023F934BB|nr:hypothetical protein [Ligilactobacillus acidipiscis]WEV58125.1 hypothetical protein OZX66_03860 [Ligilactobacillus acidipiscis]